MIANQKIKCQQCSLKVINKTQAITILQKQNQKLVYQAAYWLKRKTISSTLFL